MANVKSGRKKKLVKLLVSIIILILVATIQEAIESWLQKSEQPTTVTQSQEVENFQPQSNTQKTQGELMLYMIDVGQADSFLFVQNNQVALVDCGTRSSGDDAAKFIKSLGITKLDYVFGTHPHDDHMGGMYDIITNFEIGKIIIPKIEAGEVTTNWYIKLMEEILGGDYELEYSKTGSHYTLGNAIIAVLWQSEGEQSNVNNYSNIMKVSFGDMDVIMTGDAETKVEKEALEAGVNLDAEILKVGHHGSDTSSSEEFLDAISPDYGLISSEVGNKHEHPIKIVMERLKERGVKVYRTDESSTVTATITSEGVTFDCNPGDYLSGVELEERNAA